MEFTETTLGSGVTVSIRPRSYEEWERQENRRLEALASLPDPAKGGSAQESELLMQRAGLEIRRMRLEYCVENFKDRKAGLSMRDISLIEAMVRELETTEVPLGNSGAGGDGP